MRLVKNLIKAIVLLGLIFGVLYFGLNYYFKQQPPAAAAPPAPSKTVEDLKLLHEELAILEHKIQDLRTENKPYGDEQEVVENIRQNISELRKSIAAEVPAAPVAVPDSLEKMTTIPGQGLFSDPYQRVIIIVVGLFFLLVFIFFLVRGLISRKRAAQKRVTQNAPPPLPPKMRPREKPATLRSPEEVAAGDQRLKETLERFKTASVVIQKSETREVPLQPNAPAPAQPTPARPAPEPRKEPKPMAEKMERPAPASAGEASLIERVFDLSHQGLSIEEISGKLHIDQDQVRLILRFKR